MRLLISLFAAVILAGCAMTPTEHPLARFHETKPNSILVVPAINKSVDVMASTSVLTTLPKTLGEKGYYVFPVNTVKTLMEFEGISEAQEIHDLGAETLAQLFGADSILYITIHSWTSKYLVVSTTTEIDLEYVMTDAKGNIIFQDRNVRRYSPQSESSGNIFADLIVMAIESAVERAAPNYLPLTRQANSNAFVTGMYPLPPGPYHPDHSNYYGSFAEAADRTKDMMDQVPDSDLEPVVLSDAESDEPSLIIE